MRGGHGVQLGHNDRVTNLQLDVLSDHWYVLRRAEFDDRHRSGTVTHEVREAYDRGNGVTILLYDPTAWTVLLTRQFRLPIYLNGHPDRMLVEAAGRPPRRAGRGPRGGDPARGRGGERVRVGAVQRLFRLYMSPGSVTEHVTFFAATYSHEQRVSAGGGVRAEGEDIETVELELDDALGMVQRGEIDDAKTVLLLQWAQGQRGG